MIKFLDLKKINDHYEPGISEAISRVLSSGWYLLGNEVKAFEQEYREFGTAYDLQVLEPAASFWVKMLHLHGSQVMFDLVADYPVDIINWHDRETFPSLSLGLTRFPGLVCGGVSQETLVYGTPDQVRGRDGA